MRRLACLARVAAAASLVLLGIAPRAARAEGEAAAAEEPAYAGRPASWWAHELIDPRTAGVAREALRVIGPPALGSLVRALGGDDAALRAAVARHGVDVPGDPGPWRDAVARAVADPEPAVALAGLRLARRLGERAEPMLDAIAARLADESPETRLAAVQAIAGVGPSGARALPALVSAVEVRDARVQAAAVDALAALGPAAREAVPALVRSLGVLGPTAVVPVLVLLAKVEPGSDRVRAALRAATTNAAPAVRSAAVAAIASAARADPRAVPDLVAALRAPDRLVRTQAVTALSGGDLVSRDALEALADAVFDADEGVRRTAASVATGLGPAFAPAVPRLVANQAGKPLHESLLGILASAGPTAVGALVDVWLGVRPESRPVLLRTLQGTDPSLLDSIAARVVPGLLEDVSRAATDVESRRIETALLASFARRSPAVVPLLLDAFDRAEVPDGIGEALAQAPAARGPLLDRLASPDARIRRRVLDVLLRGGLSAEEKALVSRLLRDPEPDVRRRAAFASMRGLGPASPGAGGGPAFRSMRSRGRAAPVATIDAAAVAVVLAEACDDPDAKVRVEAVRCLGSLEAAAKDALGRVVEALADANRDVVAAAGEAVPRLAAAAEKPVAAAVLALSESDDPYRRAGAALALARGGDRSAALFAGLAALAGNEDPRVRVAALDVVAALGPDGGALEGRVTALVRDPSPDVASAASRAMQELRRARR